jgi:hypothetical protein
VVRDQKRFDRCYSKVNFSMWGGSVPSAVKSCQAMRTKVGKEDAGDLPFYLSIYLSIYLSLYIYRYIFICI